MKNDHAGARSDTSWPVEPGQSAARPLLEGLSPSPRKLRFIDLFAGLGGFHLAMKELGHECVFASELDSNLRNLYKRNFGMDAHSDVKKVDVAAIPEHDVLCAGFPCQPFSKSGKQNGLDDPKWGDLFDRILKILRHHKPDYFMLENVPNLERHKQGTTWDTVLKKLDDAGYKVKPKKLSPHRFGIPQVRERLFIVGSREELDWFKWPHEENGETSIMSVLEDNPPDAKPLSEQVLSCIDVWQEFLDRFPVHEQLPSYPIWAMEFEASYPFIRTTPFASDPQGLRRWRGAHGVPLKEFDEESILEALPSYARTEQERFPAWKVRFIKQNREFYRRHKSWIKGWRKQLLQFPSSLQKLEWNCKDEPRKLKDLVLQFRASGVRAKRTTTAPSLIAMTTTQVPIITWESRYMTTRECAALQSMESIALPETHAKAYAALGNAVNVELVRRIALALLDRDPGVEAQPSLLLVENSEVADRAPADDGATEEAYLSA
jgi:DNA (cytosine-5)-methyltransferase 1